MSAAVEVGREPEHSPRTLVECSGRDFPQGHRLGCGWKGTRKSLGGPCPQCGGDVRWATDNREIRKWVEAGGLFRAFPSEDVHCVVCSKAGRESGGCLMYPDPTPEDDEGRAPQRHRPSTICPRCSNPAAESYLRFHAERQGFDLKPVTVFGVAA